MTDLILPAREVAGGDLLLYLSRLRPVTSVRSEDQCTVITLDDGEAVIVPWPGDLLAVRRPGPDSPLAGIFTIAGAARLLGQALADAISARFALADGQGDIEQARLYRELAARLGLGTEED